MTTTPRIMREPNAWTLVESFFQAYSEFEPIFLNYESQVTQYAEQRGVDRRYLRLNAAEVSGLLDFDRLEKLRDGPLLEFKAITHARFRDISHKNRDKLDRYANELFHNVSILKEVQYMISTVAPQYDQTTEQAEYETLLADVHEEFPTLVHRLNALFRKSQERMEAMLPTFCDEKVFTRSLFLYGAELFKDVECYPNGVDDVYRIVYKNGGAIQGYYEAAKSFRASGFLDLARSAVLLGIEAYNKLETLILESGDHKKGKLFALFLDLEELSDQLQKPTPAL